MISRRTLFSSAAMLALMTTGCSQLPSLPVAVNVALPPEVTTAIGDANDIVAKVESLASSVPAAVQSLIAKAKSVLAGITSNAALQDAKSALANFASITSQVTGLIPSTGSLGTTASAIGTVLSSIARVAGVVMPLLAQRAPGRLAEAAPVMSLDQARSILRTR